MKMRYIIKKIETKKNAHEIFKGFSESGFSMFFDSSLYVEDTGRYSIIVFDPFLTFSSKNSSIELWRRSDNRTEHSEGDVINFLKNLYDAYKFDYDGELPFIGGFAGYVSYDFSEGSDQLETTILDDLQVPDMMFGLYDNVIITDNKYGHTYIAVTGISSDNLAELECRAEEIAAAISKVSVHPDAEYAGHPEHLEYTERPERSAYTGHTEHTGHTGHSERSAYTGHTEHTGHTGHSVQNGYSVHTGHTGHSAQNGYSVHTSRDTDVKSGDILKSNMTWEAYRKMIGQAREYIRNGDIYQVNLSQRFETALSEAPFEVYERLRAASPVPFAAYLNFGCFKVLSSSMERFMKIRGGIAETRPIKGTRPRGRAPAEDALNAEELLSSAKDRAEHVMIVDLERNDIGRFCEIGSVKVVKLLDLETHSNVFHLVSTVMGRIKPDVHMIDCIMSAFPGGSITGAPKIRSMEIIDELEPVKRGVYTGSIGYIGLNAVCDFNIAIRTIAVKGNRAYYHVGGGIVWDSSAEGEYAETMDKGSGMMRALSGPQQIIAE